MTVPAEHDESRDAQRRGGSSPSARTVLLRAAADGDLTTTQDSELDEYLSLHPDDAAVIELERRLRREVAALAEGRASDRLRERVRVLAAPGDEISDVPIGRVGAFGLRARQWLAVAASLVVLVSVSYVGFRTIQSGSQLNGTQAIDDSFRAALVSFVGNFHEQCEIHSEMAMRQLQVRALEEAPAAFAEVMGKTLDIGSLNISGYHYLGGGPCSVPGGGRSFHVVFESDDVEALRRPMISIFIQQDSGVMRIPPDQTFLLEQKSQTVNAAFPSEVYVWKKDGFVYFLVSTSKRALAATLNAFGVDAPSGSI